MVSEVYSTPIMLLVEENKSASSSRRDTVSRSGMQRISAGRECISIVAGVCNMLKQFD